MKKAIYILFSLLLCTTSIGAQEPHSEEFKQFEADMQDTREAIRELAGEVPNLGSGDIVSPEKQANDLSQARNIVSRLSLAGTVFFYLWKKITRR